MIILIEHMSCRFCEIDPRRTVILEEKEHCLVIFANPRLVPGHLLVIPKRHIEFPADMTDDERADVFATVLEYQSKMLSGFSSGCDIRQNCRPFLPEGRIKVDHVHYHILPREMNDPIHMASGSLGELASDVEGGEIEGVKEFFNKS